MGLSLPKAAPSQSSFQQGLSCGLLCSPLLHPVWAGIPPALYLTALSTQLHDDVWSPACLRQEACQFGLTPLPPPAPDVSSW